jgi:hypothetical protein
MEKKVFYQGKEYTIEIRWSGSNYWVMCIENFSGFRMIPNDCLDDIEKIKPYIKNAIENNHDIKVIELWDGNL